MPYLPTAMESILRQTYPDFHFLIVDDASTDDTCQIVRSYSDKRIELLCLKENMGQTAALNAGLRQASTQWVARMDADDYSAPTRLEEQMRALDANSSLSCVGCYAWTFREDHKVAEGEITTHIHHADIKKALLKGSPLIHGSIVVERQALLEVGAYTDRYRYSADVEMYDRLLAKYQAATVPQRLLGIRRHADQGSRTRRALDEIIEIFGKRLSAGGYTREEAAIIRKNHARFYLFRAQKCSVGRDYRQASKDLLSALKASPGSFLPNAIKAFVVDLVPERKRATLKRLLVRVP
jgi:glycosyltransferase involved in cell wall biosynthesis